MPEIARALIEKGVYGPRRRLLKYAKSEFTI